MRGRSQGYTLKNHCHNGYDEDGQPLDLRRGFKEPCPYFDTKPENIPPKLSGAIQTAEEYKELKRLGLLAPDLGQITAFEYECYKIAEEASDMVEAEETRKAIAESKKGQGKEKYGASKALPPLPSNNDPFGSWEE